MPRGQTVPHRLARTHPIINRETGYLTSGMVRVAAWPAVPEPVFRVGVSSMIAVPFECTGRLGDPRTRKTPERLPPQGPPPPPPPRSLERVPPNPATLGETVELSVSDDPCPGSFGTEQPEPAVHMAIYHYASRMGHFHTRHPVNRRPLPEHTDRSDQIRIPETSLPARQAN